MHLTLSRWQEWNIGQAASSTLGTRVHCSGRAIALVRTSTQSCDCVGRSRASVSRAGVKAHRTLFGAGAKPGTLSGWFHVPSVTCGGPYWQRQRPVRCVVAPAVLAALRLSPVAFVVHALEAGVFLRRVCRIRRAVGAACVMWCAVLGSHPGGWACLLGSVGCHTGCRKVL